MILSSACVCLCVCVSVCMCVPLVDGWMGGWVDGVAVAGAKWDWVAGRVADVALFVLTSNAWPTDGNVMTDLGT